MRDRCKLALLSSAPRGFAARSHVLARLVSLAEIGELARRLQGQRKCVPDRGSAEPGGALVLSCLSQQQTEQISMACVI